MSANASASYLATTAIHIRGHHVLDMRLFPPSLHLSSEWTPLIIPLFLGYLLLCRLLRFRREKAAIRQYKYPDRESLAKMTNDDAQSIIKYLSMYEFPFTMVTSLQFALFKTYGIPTIAKLLVATDNFASNQFGTKRYADTGALIGEFMGNSPTSERAIKAIGRMNFLHSSYKARGQISNADFLYTLSVFVTEPIRFIKLYEWRNLNDMEIAAMGTFWKSIGDAMEIEYEGYLENPGKWKDGIEFVEDITAWAKKYECGFMKPHKSNHQLAVTLIPMLVDPAPAFMKSFASDIVYALMGDRVRESFILPEPGIIPSATIFTLLSLRQFFLRYLSLPRFRQYRKHNDPDPKTGRITTIPDYLVHPFYVKPTFWSRWGPSALLWKMMGGILPGDDGDKYAPQGFLYKEVGPINRKNQGLDHMQASEERLRSERPSGCPFAI